MLGISQDATGHSDAWGGETGARAGNGERAGEGTRAGRSGEVREEKAKASMNWLSSSSAR